MHLEILLQQILNGLVLGSVYALGVSAVVMLGLMLLVEQNALLALQAADRTDGMDSGQISMHGPAAQLLHDRRVREAYLGESGPTTG